jgi:phosphoribosylanthranilate isomerase
MNDSNWKVDTGHKSGYLTYIEKEMAKVLPHADLKADLHIMSKVKILKKQLSYVLEIMQNGSGFGWDDEMKMVVGGRDTYMGLAKVKFSSI